VQDKEQVVKKGVYFFDSKPFVVKEWNPDMDLPIENIKSLPLWIRLPELDIKYWGSDSLSKICSVLGVPLKADRYTKDKTMINYARVLVEFSIVGPFPETVEFSNETNTLIQQAVTYEWIPTKCTHCHMYGHLKKVCRKKGIIRKEWRKVDRPAEHPPTTPASEADLEGFTPVNRKDCARQPVKNSTQPALQDESRFSILEIEIQGPEKIVTIETTRNPPPPMANLSSWNIQGLNWPNKQEEVKLFLHSHSIGVICLMETKVKLQNVEKVAAETFPGWKWIHNFVLNPKSRLWLA